MSTENNRLALIPARGGSKRIPHKNVKPFCGNPIIHYSIRAALDSGLFSEVMVSTDSAEIARIAVGHGASVPFFRSEANSNDFAGTIDVIQEVLTAYKSQGKQFTEVCCIYPTAPFIKPSRLAEGLQILQKGYDSVFPVTAYSYPVQRALRFHENRIRMVDDSFYHARSQDLEKIYHDAGQFYWLRTAAVFEKGRLFTDNSFGLEISELEVQDIDNETDWKLAELKYRLLNETNL